MRKRRSVRDFDGKGLSDRQNARLSRLLAVATYPFGGRVESRIASRRSDISFKAPSYGMISGTQDYILVGCDGTFNSLVSAGYGIQRVLIDMLSGGVAACWVGGTFRKSAFSSVAKFSAGIGIVAVIPVGVPAERPGIVSRMTRLLGHSSSRKPFASLFEAADTSRFKIPLEMMRIAPSALNRQPWTSVATDTRVAFGCKDMSPTGLISFGVGLAQFSIACEELNISGRWAVSDRSIAFIAGE